jgi:hypothetical protein
VDQPEAPRVIRSFNQRKLLAKLTIAIRIVRFYWKQIEPVPSIVPIVFSAMASAGAELRIIFNMGKINDIIN